MSYMTAAIIVLAVLNVGIALGRIVERKSIEEKAIVLRQYEGLGSGVLAPGTVVKGSYEGPNSVSGKLDIGGVWRIDEDQK